MANATGVRSTTEQDYIDHWNKVVEHEEEDMATIDRTRARQLKLCEYWNKRDRYLQGQSWILGALPLNKPPMEPVEVREFLEKWSGEGKDYDGEEFTVVFIGEDGKQHRHVCYPLTIGKNGFGGGPALDPWSKGEGTCIVAECESVKGVGNIIEFKLDKVISIVTCAKFKEIARAQ